MIDMTIAITSVSRKGLHQGPLKPVLRTIAKKKIVPLLLPFHFVLFLVGLFCAWLRVPQRSSSPPACQLLDFIFRQKVICVLLWFYSFWEDDLCLFSRLAHSLIQNFHLTCRLSLCLFCWKCLFRVIDAFYQSCQVILSRAPCYPSITKSPVKDGS